MADIKLEDYTSRLEKAGNTKTAMAVIQSAIADTTKGFFNIGVSDGDQKVIYQLLQQFQKDYPSVDISSALDIWNPKKNSVNALEKASAEKTFTNAVTTYNSKYGSVEQQKGYDAATYTPVDTSDPNTLVFKPQEPTSISTSSSSSTPVTSTSSGSSAPDYGYSAYTQRLEERLAGLEDILNEMNEKANHKYTADELAEMYNQQDAINLDKVLADYNDKTNAYYDEYDALYNQMRNELSYNSWRNAGLNARDALETQQYQSRTQDNVGSNAAVRLATQLGIQNNVAANDYENLQLQYAAQERRKAELANNPYLAQQDVNNSRLMLEALGANINEATAKQAMAASQSYSTAYQGYRAAQGNDASAYQSKYSGLAKAAANNAYTASNSYNNYINSPDFINALYQSLGYTQKQSATAAVNYQNINNSSWIS